MIRRWLWAVLVTLLLWNWGGEASASPLAERVAQFPDWQGKPPTQIAQGDLAYPDWFQGTWLVTTTLTEMTAPLAPGVTTPGFEGNRPYLNQPIPFHARFVAQTPRRAGLGGWGERASQPIVVADRAFNGRNLAKAYLDPLAEPGKSPVRAVKVDPENPNRQITLLRGDRQLVSTVVERAVEQPTDSEFITSEIFLQEFRGSPQLYFNKVETTTDYTLHPGERFPIRAEQFTAIYLSPQDPDYFKTGDQPVALYRYHMDFTSPS
jgi:hypothetical protein